MLTESMEDYLEMIYRIVEEKGYIRAVDLAEALQLQPSSITKMIQKLDRAGFLKYKKYRHISLTALGKRYGQFLVWRDKTLNDFLQLLVKEASIEEQVEGIEHYITPETMKLINSLIIYFQKNEQACQKIKKLQQKKVKPCNQALELLRAWEYKHSLDD